MKRYIIFIFLLSGIALTSYQNQTAWEVWTLDLTNTQTTYILDGKTGDILDKTVIEDFFFVE